MRLHSLSRAHALVKTPSPRAALTVVPFTEPDDTGYMTRVSPATSVTTNATIYACIALLSAAVADSEFRVLTSIGTRRPAETRRSGC